MVNGPPCAVCGFTLRWLPQQSSWGCDRCQRMFPAQGAPQQQAAPPAGPSPWAPPGAQPPQQGFAPPQQQGFRPPNQSAPPQQQPYQPPPQQGFQPPQQQGFGAAPSHPPAAHPYAQPQQPNQYAQPAYGHQPQQPPQQQPYSPHPAHPTPPAGAMPAPAGGKKSGKGLIIGLAVAAVAVAGGVIAFVATRGGGGISGGGSRSDVVKSTLAALGDGDVDQLMKLADVPGLYDKIVDCSGKTKALVEPGEDDKVLTEKDKEEQDPKKETEKRRKQFEEIAPRTKGASIELVEIVTKEPPAPKDDEKKADDDDDLGGVMKTGTKLMKGCVAKTPIRLHEAKLKIKVKPKGETAIDQESEIMLIQVGSGYYLAMPPAISLGTAALEKELTAMRDKVCACKDAACAEKLSEDFKASPRRKTLKQEIKALSDKDKEKIDKIDDEMDACERKLSGGGSIGAMEQFRDKICACNDQTCAEKVTQEITVWSNSNKDEKLSEEDTKKATAIGEEMGKCMTRIYSTGATAGGIGATIASAGGLAEASADLPQGCKDYRDMILKLSTCSKFPEVSRKALLDGWKAMNDAWKNFDFKTMPPESIKSIEDGCKQGTDALKQAGASMGC